MMKGDDQYVPRVTHFPKREVKSDQRPVGIVIRILRERIFIFGYFELKKFPVFKIFKMSSSLAVCVPMSIPNHRKITTTQKIASIGLPSRFQAKPKKRVIVEDEEEVAEKAPEAKKPMKLVTPVRLG